MTTELHFPVTRCLFGVATRDVTPPIGTYARTWGAAAHDAADGIHRPCMATAALFAPAGDGAPEGPGSLEQTIAEAGDALETLVRAQA